jgi:hypothetical protein
MNSKIKAKLIQLEGIEWNTDFQGDMKREQYHRMKMQSKDDRAASQMELFGLPTGIVEHIL